MRVVPVLLTAAALGGASYVGARGAGPLPPLGPFLDPAHGVWGAVATREFPSQEVAKITGLIAPVEVRYDQRGVPHIFAQNDEDMGRALGFVVARDRLFQMDLQVRAGAGTLTELLGAAALPADSETRSIGLPRGAERAWRALPDTSQSKRFANAYAEGVNAYIAGLTPDREPVEYKMLGVHPPQWTGINTVHLANRMAYTLTYGPNEQELSAAEALVGRAAARAVFPVSAPIQEPIQPNGLGAPRFAFGPLAPPGATDSTGALGVFPVAEPWKDESGIRRSFASNNWAVAPSRSATGKALLAGDPHLELTLPSIWFEVHMVIPGKLDVYGVTIPSAAGVLIGFTRELAWSFTNTGADVVDYYRETVDDDATPRRYLLDDAWKDLDRREEVYRDKNGRTIRVDTVRYTHRGPLTRMGAGWVSMRWTALEPSDLGGALARAQRTHTAQAFLDSLATSFFVPAQNTIVADRAGTIAIRSTGHYPIRPDNGDGRLVRDGSSSASDWRGYWPVASYPQSVNPVQGFLASANQQPIDPAVEPRYLGADDAYESWRALRINRLLRENAKVTVSDMRSFQTNAGSERARLFLPYFLGASASRRALGKGSPRLAAADSVLRAWDGMYRPENAASALFEQSMRALVRLTWDELVPSGKAERVATPTTNVLLALLSDSSNRWWDERKTREVQESRDDVVAQALEVAYDSLVARAGAPSATAWRWDKLGAVNVNHLLRLGGFSRRGIGVTGGPGTLNPSGPAGFGSSWRMVVELGARVTALGTYPGGQSGNPASARYDDRLKVWARGDLELLYAPPALDSVAAAQVIASLSLRPVAGGK